MGSDIDTRRIPGGAGLARRLGGAALGTWLLLALGCAQLGLPDFGLSGVPAEQQQEFDAAVVQLADRPDAAADALRAFLSRHPNSQLADDAAERLADLAFAEGHEDAGLQWLRRILSQAPNSDRAPHARLRLAQFEYARNRADRARDLIAKLEVRRLPLSDQRAALRLQVSLARTPVERVSMLGRLRDVIEIERRSRRSDPAIRARLDDRLGVVDHEIASAVARAKPAELEAMLSELRGAPGTAAVLLELARRDLDLRAADRAEERLGSAAALVRGEAERQQLEGLRTRLAALQRGPMRPERVEPGEPFDDWAGVFDDSLPETAGARGTLGVVLPLSGRFAQFGAQSLRGLLLATGSFDSLTPTTLEALAGEGFDPTAIRVGRGIDVRLVVRDSGSDPERAADAVRDLASDPSIVAILGPIFSDESLAAADAAQEMAVPLVTLTHREEVPAGRDFVFRTRTTPKDEVGRLVEYAFEELGARRYAVLYPESRYGRGMRKLFWDSITERGGKMVAAASYDPAATDFAAPIRDMIGYRFLTSGERAAIRKREEMLRATRVLSREEARAARAEAYAMRGPEGTLLPPVVDFDVLFIPDVAEKVALIAPGLAFHEVRGVRLLGTSDWVDDQLLKVGRRHVSGSIISSAFAPESDLPIVTKFLNAFESTFRREPDVYAAQAFDAANLVLSQLAAGRTDRYELRDGLLTVVGFPGATGVLTMRSDGNAARRPFLLGVKDQSFVPLD